MKKHPSLWAGPLLVVVVILVGSQDVYPYGEEENGFPSWKERMVLVMVNRARADPPADLADCEVCAESACYDEALPPLYYSYDLTRAARFHAANQISCGCGLAHDSPCTLVSDIGDQYDPGPCDGSASCACEGGTCPCSGTSWSDRVSRFGTSPTGENIAYGYSDPIDTFYQWFWEPESDPSCGFRMTNGHRYNILGSHGEIGCGEHGSWWGQDFGGGRGDYPIPSGSHHPDRPDDEVDFRAHWYDDEPPSAAMVNVDGTCYPMKLERGSSTNGTFIYTGPVEGDCPRYYFMFEDSDENEVLYPETGSFGIGDECDDWSADRPSGHTDCDYTYESETVTGGCGCEIVS